MTHPTSITPMKIAIVIHPEEGHGFWVEVPTLPGCVSQGDSIEQAVANIREAILAVLEIDLEGIVIEPNDKILEIEI
ncbi:MAG: type II toxin-antitoxin system HicB family antitoxin [Ignavibacteria bacterium]|nr:type II toxin-antitoxin system HicB family antitoxin [Ignavibacteria bacterium]MBK6418406.1 type II toxin-antitoxin system HicB family antitoxin [Ignavibacteria bacterium]MBK6761056.1 type II toxin-antitoxin system HicB family antitoxin [Ignavibacteria bacterium]MBK7032075.1 type II toxin-antitoxin system HicB family antitoxin [Ignavibacteria bacterium]MBK7186767.1 type II toxin-antitoxin system HicB family antitoxin [Ignavibacteria bacterium]